MAAGLLQAAGCEDFQAAAVLPTEDALQPAVTSSEESWRLEETSEMVEIPRGRRTGMTLYDVVRDLEWRQAAFDKMVAAD